MDGLFEKRAFGGSKVTVPGCFTPITGNWLLDAQQFAYHLVGFYIVVRWELNTAVKVWIKIWRASKVCWYLFNNGGSYNDMWKKQNSPEDR
jgi:hypothetical protein